MQEVRILGPLFEHYLNLKPWDLERMTLEDVVIRLDWIKHRHGIDSQGEDEE